MAVDLKQVPSTPGVYKFFSKSEIIYGVDTDLNEVQNSKFKSLIEKPFKKWYEHFN